MTGAEFHYCNKEVTDLSPGECVIRRTRDEHGSYLSLALRVVLSDGATDTIVVPVSEDGKADAPRLTWGIARNEPGHWQVSPSIRYSTRRDDADVELWHEVPVLLGVPEPAPWITFSWDTLQKRADGKTLLLHRHERVFAEPFAATARDVLDVGGWGVLATRMIEEGKNCTILDKFTADQYYAERVRSLPHKEGDVCDHQCFPGDSFDLITCFECLEHVRGTVPASLLAYERSTFMLVYCIEAALASIHYWLRPGGWLVGTVPIPGVTHPADEPGIEFIDETTLRTYLERRGFGDIFTEPTISIGLPDEQPSSLYFRARKP